MTKVERNETEKGNCKLPFFQLEFLGQCRKRIKLRYALDMKMNGTLQEISELWLKSIQLRTKESTYSTYVMLVNNHIIPDLGRYPMSEINFQTLENYIYEQTHFGRIDRTGPLASNTIRLLHCILKSILKYGEQLGYPHVSFYELSKPKLSQRELHLFTNEEQKRLEQYLLEQRDLASFGIYICLYTGLRLGEICALKWQDIHLEDQYLCIKKTLQRIQIVDAKERQYKKTRILIDSPKSSASIREIPLVPSVVRIFQRFYIPGKWDSYILTGDPNRYMDPRTYQKKFHRCLVACDISHRNFHTLRHQFATNCIAMGVDIKSLSEILGHSSVNITLNRYVHSNFELKKKQLDKLDRLSFSYEG